MDFKLLLAFVDCNRAEAVLDAARNAGATGATIIDNAQGQGLERHLTFFGMELLGMRTVILVLVDDKHSSAVLEAMAAAGELDARPETGIALELDVGQTRGLSEHIQAIVSAATRGGSRESPEQ